MVKVWLGFIDCPKSVFSNTPFDINYREWFLGWPFKKYEIYSYIIKDNGEVIDFSYEIKLKWFWGCKEHTHYEEDGIEKDTKYEIEVGYER